MWVMYTCACTGSRVVAGSAECTRSGALGRVRRLALTCQRLQGQHRSKEVAFDEDGSRPARAARLGAHRTTGHVRIQASHDRVQVVGLAGTHRKVYRLGR
jgi:hypothetical protein